VVKSRGRHCGDLELKAYLANAAGPVPLVLDLRLTHDRIGSSANPALNGTLHYPNNIDESLNQSANDKIRKYRADCNNNPPNVVAFMLVLLVRMVDCTVNLSGFYSYRLIGKLTAFLQFQEFSQRNQTWEDSSTFAARLFLLCSNLGLETSWLRPQLYV
jgi:hypothetical protein